MEFSRENDTLQGYGTNCLGPFSWQGRSPDLSPFGLGSYYLTFLPQLMTILRFAEGILVAFNIAAYRLIYDPAPLLTVL